MIATTDTIIKNVALSVALSSNIYASVHKKPLKNIVFALKEILQWWRDHIPYMQNIDIYRGETLISSLPITNTYQKLWRLLQNIPRTGIVYSWYMHWSAIIEEAKRNLSTLLLEQALPENISKETSYAMVLVALSIVIYWSITKWWDIEAYKTLLSKNNHSWDDPDA